MDKDNIMLFLLTQFIKDGFPVPDPDRQVALAYMYAEAVERYKRGQDMVALQIKEELQKVVEDELKRHNNTNNKDDDVVG